MPKQRKGDVSRSDATDCAVSLTLRAKKHARTKLSASSKVKRPSNSKSLKKKQKTSLELQG